MTDTTIEHKYNVADREHEKQIGVEVLSQTFTIKQDGKEVLSLTLPVANHLKLIQGEVEFIIERIKNMML